VDEFLLAGQTFGAVKPRFHSFAFLVRPWAFLGLALLGLPGCSMMSGSPTSPASAAISAPAARPADPLADFAARAQPGQSAMVGSPPVAVRVLRTYNSGAGHPCRELLLGGTNAGRQVLYCEDVSGQWTGVRPLLRGSAGWP
jgi:hypothetical protein